MLLRGELCRHSGAPVRLQPEAPVTTPTTPPHIPAELGPREVLPQSSIPGRAGLEPGVSSTQSSGTVFAFLVFNLNFHFLYSLYNLTAYLESRHEVTVLPPAFTQLLMPFPSWGHRTAQGPRSSRLSCRSAGAAVGRDVPGCALRHGEVRVQACVPTAALSS